MVPVVEPVTTLRLESPAGLIEVQAEVRDGRVLSVTFRNVPAFAVHLDAVVEVPQLGSVTVDVAWGGMFYVIADAERVRPADHARTRPATSSGSARWSSSRPRSSCPSAIPRIRT